MATFLSEEWIAGLPAAAGDAGAPGPSATVAVDVSGGKVGDAKWSFVLEDGRITDTAYGPRADTAVQFTIARVDAEAMLAGTVAPDVAFMRGKLKAAGDMELVLALLEWTTTPAFAALRDRVVAATDT